MKLLLQQYYCPMYCEGEKIYDQPGDCPVCNMHLIVKDEKYAPAEYKKQHQGHHHHHAHDAHHHPEVAKDGAATYYCPMYCEGDKTYDKAGDCLKCGMHLIKEAKAKPSGTIYTC